MAVALDSRREIGHREPFQEVGAGHQETPQGGESKGGEFGAAVRSAEQDAAVDLAVPSAKLDVIAGDDAAHGMPHQVDLLDPPGVAQLIDLLGHPFGQGFDVLPGRQVQGVAGLRIPVFAGDAGPRTSRRGFGKVRAEG